MNEPAEWGSFRVNDIGSVCHANAALVNGATVGEQLAERFLKGIKELIAKIGIACI
jgi:hypothetical protein